MGDRLVSRIGFFVALIRHGEPNRAGPLALQLPGSRHHGDETDLEKDRRAAVQSR